MRLLLILAIALLAGCTSLQMAGSAEYSVKPVLTAAGPICCEVTIRNGKEIASLKATVTRFGDDYTVSLEEEGVKAFKGQEITAKAVQAMIDDAVKAAAAASLAPAIPVLGGLLK